MNFIKKYWVLISWVIAFFLDGKYGILEHFIKDVFWINILKGLGALALAYNTEKNLASKDGDIGGGGIKNPPPVKQ